MLVPEGVEPIRGRVRNGVNDHYDVPHLLGGNHEADTATRGLKHVVFWLHCAMRSGSPASGKRATASGQCVRSARPTLHFSSSMHPHTFLTLINLRAAKPTA